eukprot:142751-Prorocentrum_minimum.AAC.1
MFIYFLLSVCGWGTAAKIPLQRVAKNSRTQTQECENEASQEIPKLNCEILFPRDSSHLEVARAVSAAEEVGHPKVNCPEGGVGVVLVRIGQHGVEEQPHPAPSLPSTPPLHFRFGFLFTPSTPPLHPLYTSASVPSTPPQHPVYTPSTLPLQFPLHPLYTPSTLLLHFPLHPLYTPSTLPLHFPLHPLYTPSTLPLQFPLRSAGRWSRCAPPNRRITGGRGELEGKCRSSLDARKPQNPTESEGELEGV